jgi:hypothetical protein
VSTGDTPTNVIIVHLNITLVFTSVGCSWVLIEIRRQVMMDYAFKDNGKMTWFAFEMGFLTTVYSHTMTLW